MMTMPSGHMAPLLLALSAVAGLGPSAAAEVGGPPGKVEKMDANTPPTFPLSAEQAASPRLPDAFRQAVADWASKLHDPATGGFAAKPGGGADLLATADVVWTRYACNADDLGAPDRDRTIAYLDAQVPRLSGHRLWMAVRAIRILGGQPSRMPARYDGITGPAAFEAHVRDHIVKRHAHHHEILGLLPLVVSSGDPNFTSVLLKAIADAQDPAGHWPAGGRMDWSRTFAYSAIHLAAGERPPRAEKIIALMERELTKGDRIVVSPAGGYHDMDALFVLVRLPAAINHPRAKEIRDRIRAGLPEFRRALPAAQDKLLADPHHGMLAAAHILGLLQEAAPDELPGDRPFRFDWDKLDLYNCRRFAAKR